nr:solute carrier family 23 protein [Bacillus sp. B15-48]
MKVGIEERLSLGENITYGFQHILALTGIWIFPGLIGAALGLDVGTIGYIVQACFITTGIITILQSGRLLKLPVVQGPTAAFFVAIMVTGLSQGLGTAYGSMTVAGLIFLCLAIPIGKWGIMGHCIKFMSPPIVYGSLLVIIGAQLSSIGVANWFGQAGTAGYPSLNFLTAIITILSILLLMIFGGNSFLRRGALLWGIVIGTIFYMIFGSFNMTAVNEAPLFSLPEIYPFGFHVSWPVVVLMLIAYLQAAAEAMGMYVLLTDWDKQKLTKNRVNRGMFGEFLGTTIGSVFGGIGTTSYPENIGIIRVSGIGSRYVVMTAGIIAIILGLIPKIGVLIAIIPGAVLAGASTVLFGIITFSGIQMLSKVNWDELNLAVAGTAFIISVGTMFLPAEILAMLSPSVNSIVSQPMLVGVILLILLNTVVNMLIRPRLEKKNTNYHESSPELPSHHK